MTRETVLLILHNQGAIKPEFQSIGSQPGLPSARTSSIPGTAGYGKVNEHNAPVPRDFWLEEREREAALAFYHHNPLEGYRRLTFIMLDQNIFAISPTITWRIFRRPGF